MTDITVYKLVKCIGGKRYSAVLKQLQVEVAFSYAGGREILHNNLRQYTLEYVPNKWKRPPKGTPLMAFDNKENAYEFLLKFREFRTSKKHGFEIWESLATVAPNSYSRWIAPIGAVDFGEFWSEWKKPFRIMDNSFLHAIPEGTVFCTRLKLIEKVWPVEKGDEDE